MHLFSLSGSNFWLQISAVGGWTTEIVETSTAWLSFSLQRVPQFAKGRIGFQNIDHKLTIPLSYFAVTEEEPLKLLPILC